MNRSLIIMAFSAALLFFILAAFVATTQQQALINMGFGILASFTGLAFLRRAREQGLG